MKNKNKSTKFPVARIKKIMQKDEEVGKVAQATPVVISKALEMFLSMIVDEAHKVTKERGSRKVESYHLKHAVERVVMLDFLKELVEGIPDPSAGGTIDVESEKAEGRKRKIASRRRKKKVDQDAEEEGDNDDGAVIAGIKDEDTENTDGEAQTGKDEDMEWDDDDYKGRKPR